MVMVVKGEGNVNGEIRFECLREGKDERTRSVKYFVWNREKQGRRGVLEVVLIAGWKRR